MKKMYSLNEIGLLPSSTPSPIHSRKDVNPYVCHINLEAPRIKLPLFVSPMPCIVNKDNYSLFNEYVQPILPRGKDVKAIAHHMVEGKWAAVSLREFVALFCYKISDEVIEAAKVNPVVHVCIDMANGHMEELCNAIKTAKSIFKDNLVIMAGNIAHPKMYVELADAGADYIRVGIGGGNACSTSVLTGIHASLPWLLEEITKIKALSSRPFKAKVVADGGIDTIDKAIKCLALGADFVMMGKMFAQCKEACGETKTIDTWNVERGIPEAISIYSYTSSKKATYRKYFGNASADGQKEMFGKATKPSEGVSTWVEVNTTIKEFSDKFESALRSAMSYTGASKLSEFVGKVEWKPMSIEEFKSYYKKDES